MDRSASAKYIIIISIDPQWSNGTKMEWKEYIKSICILDFLASSLSLSRSYGCASSFSLSFFSLRFCGLYWASFILLLFFYLLNYLGKASKFRRHSGLREREVSYITTKGRCHHF